MVSHAIAELPNECCGLLAGRLPEATSETAIIVRRYPLTNQARSPTEYLSEPQSMFAAHRDMRRLGLEVLSIYHSHPSSEPIPSRRDIERNNYGAEVVHFIISLSGAAPQIRAWRLSSDSYAEADWIMIESSR
jgi:proteasome lid subunit RPN8/RPN11